MKCWDLENPTTDASSSPPLNDNSICQSELPAVCDWSDGVSGGGVYREANRAISAAGAWKMTRKVTWCAGSAIGSKSDVQPPFVKLYLSTFYPHVRRDRSQCTGGVSSVYCL